MDNLTETTPPATEATTTADAPAITTPAETEATQEIISTEAPATTVQPAPAPETTKAPRRRFEIDATKATVTIHEAGKDNVVFACGSLPATSQFYLMALGLSTTLRLAPDEDYTKAFDKLRGGDFPRPSEKGANGDHSPLKQAIALALIDAAALKGNVLTMEQATATVARMDRGTIGSLRSDPTVMAHFARIANKTPALDAFLAKSQADEPAAEPAAEPTDAPAAEAVAA